MPKQPVSAAGDGLPKSNERNLNAIDTVTNRIAQAAAVVDLILADGDDGKFHANDLVIINAVWAVDQLLSDAVKAASDL